MAGGTQAQSQREREAGLDIFEAIGRKMAWLGQRQSVLAQNIANADTPDYRPQDLKEGAFASALRRSLPKVRPAATDPKHLQGTAMRDGEADVDDQKRVYEVAPSGNSVVLEEQMIKVGKTQMDYQMLSNLYRRHAEMLRTALGRGGG